MKKKMNLNLSRLFKTRNAKSASISNHIDRIVLLLTWSFIASSILFTIAQIIINIIE